MYIHVPAGGAPEDGLPAPGLGRAPPQLRHGLARPGGAAQGAADVLDMFFLISFVFHVIVFLL